MADTAADIAAAVAVPDSVAVVGLEAAELGLKLAVASGMQRQPFPSVPGPEVLFVQHVLLSQQGLPDPDAPRESQGGWEVQPEIVFQEALSGALRNLPSQLGTGAL